MDGLKRSSISGIQVSNDDILAILYADDLANVSHTVRALQVQIDVILNFYDTTDMRINLSKTKIIVSRNGAFLKEYENGNLKENPLRLFFMG